MNELNAYMKLRISDTEGMGEEGRKVGRKYWQCCSANGIYTVLFLYSRKFKITNHGPQAVSLKEPETPIPFLKQVCENFETVSPM